MDPMTKMLTLLRLLAAKPKFTLFQASKTWEEHTKTGFYIRNSWEHYRCHEVWVQDTKHTRVGQTVVFRHKKLTDPIMTPNDTLIQATQDLCNILNNKEPAKVKRALRLKCYLNFLRATMAR